MSCKKFTGVSLADLYKRCPVDQLKQFKVFRAKTAEYKSRLSKLPECLPTIDWDYYRENVRPEYCKWVEEFEAKYCKLCEQFDSRHELDTKKYYVELEKLREVVKQDVAKFKVESNKRIKAYRDEIERINSMMPYNQMTMEDYINTHPHPLRQPNGEPTFWPHTPEEQPSYVEPTAAQQPAAEGKGGAVPTPKPSSSSSPTPAAAKATDKSTATAAAAAPKPKPSEPKKKK